MIYRRYSILTICLFTLVLLAPTVGARAEIGLGAFGSWGSLKDSNAAIPAVRSSTLGAYVLPSFSIFPFLSVGAYGEYHRVGQLTDPASVSNNNKAFSGYLVGGALTFDGILFRLSGAYTFYGKGTMNEKTSGGLESTLVGPKGMHAILGIKVLPLVSLDFGYAVVKYDVHVNGVTTGQTREWTDYRAGASVNF